MHIALSRRRVARAASMRREVSHGRAAHGRAAHGRAAHSRPLSPDPLHAHMHGYRREPAMGGPMGGPAGVA